MSGEVVSGGVNGGKAWQARIAKLEAALAGYVDDHVKIGAALAEACSLLSEQAGDCPKYVVGVCPNWKTGCRHKEGAPVDYAVCWRKYLLREDD